ncbi:leucine-rich repeat domain-containing protein [Brachyspira intermedia]|uniref:leucine-rich repeat domain-containing protein n=1 Tax=Brachyspira intermedia TaxID=84377 RepID=UPI0030051052
MIKKILLIFMSVLVFVSCSATVMSPGNNGSNSGSGTEEGGGGTDIPWTEIEPPLMPPYPILDAEAMEYGIDISQDDNVIKEEIKTKLKKYKQAYGKNKVIFIGTPKAEYSQKSSLVNMVLEMAKEIYIQNVTIDISKVYFNERKIKSSMCRAGVYVGYFELSFILPENSIRVIEGNAFSLNNYFKEITIPDSVIGIDAAAFQKSEALEKITISKNSKLEYVGDYAFSYAKAKEIVIPASVTSLGRKPFGDSLTTVTYLGTKPNTISNNGDVFDSCVNLKTLIIPNAENPSDPAWINFLGGNFSEVRR